MGLTGGKAMRVQPDAKNSSSSSLVMPASRDESSGKPPQALPRSKRSPDLCPESLVLRDALGE